jgi:hypothetical protein
MIGCLIEQGTSENLERNLFIKLKKPYLIDAQAPTVPKLNKS